jgi:hypothetical protein
MGKGSSERGKIRQGSSDPQKDTLDSCAKEDRGGAESAMGRSEDFKKDCLIL